MMKKLWCILLFIAVVGQLSAQEKIQVVTKTINRSFSVGQGESLKVQGEKSEIRIKQWNRPEIKLVLQLIAKHPSRQVAEEDLSALRYHINDDAPEKIIKNFFRITEGASQVSSNLQARYELWVPVGCPLAIQNRYGNIYLSGLETDLDIVASLGEVHLNHIKGSLTLQVDYGDVIGNEVDGTVSGTIKKTNLTLNRLSGSLSLESSYGEIYVSARNRLQKMIIDASRTEVTFAAPNLTDYYYRLATSFNKINTTLPGEWGGVGVLDRKTSFTSHHPMMPAVIISTTFSPITLNQLTDDYPSENAANRRP